MSARNRLPLHIAAVLAAASLVCCGPEARPPYPPSSQVAGIDWQRESLVLAAHGSDQFPVTWGGDGHLYTAWGDGGGFGGGNHDGRASVGVARIEGPPEGWRGVNLWGGKGALSPQPPTVGKPNGGLIAIGNRLDLFVTEQDEWRRAALWRSLDGGMSWRNLGWIFAEPDAAFASPGLIQFGRGYAGARDGYVYGYGRQGLPHGLALFRVPRDELDRRSAYEFFAGLGADGAPTWTGDVARRQAVFSDPNGVEWGVTAVFHPTLARYWLAVRHQGRSGRWGLFDAPEPWGPWTTIAYGSDFPEWLYSVDPDGASRDRAAWLHVFPTRWMSPDGATLWQVSDRGDRFNLVKGRVRLRPGVTLGTADSQR